MCQRPLPHNTTVSEVLSEQFLKTKPIKPVIEVGQHKTVDIEIGWQAANRGRRVEGRNPHRQHIFCEHAARLRQVGSEVVTIALVQNRSVSTHYVRRYPNPIANRKQ